MQNLLLRQEQKRSTEYLKSRKEATVTGLRAKVVRDEVRKAVGG